MDTVVTKKNDLKKPTNVTKILKPFSSRESTDRPSVDQFSKKGYLGSNAKKLDSISTSAFKINGYKMFRKDRDRFVGGLVFYVNEQSPSNVLSLESIPIDIELILLEFTVKNQRWLCVGIYRPPSQNEKYFIDHLSKTLGQLSRQYDKTVLIGDFNLTIDNKSLENFMTTFDLERLIKKPTCFQSSNPTYIDLILTNKKEFLRTLTLLKLEFPIIII